MLDQVMSGPESSHADVPTPSIPPAQVIDSKSKELKSAPTSQPEPQDDSEIPLDHIISDSDSNAEQSNISALLAHRRRQRLKVESQYGPEVKQIISDKRNWGGWHTTTNDPSVFEYILREAGCRGIRVEEIYSMDEAEVERCRPCFGLIFLMGYNSDYEREVKEMSVGVPKELWFANQTAENACCTYGLLNIIMNVDENLLGEELRNFKRFTSDLPPHMKGIAVSSFKLMKDAQNSFGARFEMEDADIALEEAAKACNQREDDDDSDAAEEWERAFHYIAYVYVSGSVWELDGLKNNPVKVCDCPREEFEKMSIEKMKSRTEQYPSGEYHFGILALSRCRLRDARAQRVKDARELAVIDDRLMEMDSKFHEKRYEDIVGGLYIVKPPRESDLPKFANLSKDELLALRLEYMHKQKFLDETISMEQKALDEMNTSLERKRFDYEPFILQMAQFVMEDRRAAAAAAGTGTMPKASGSKVSKSKGKRARK